MTFAIPAGQRVFLSGITDYVRKKPKPEDNKPKPSQQPVDTPAPSNGRRTRLATRSLRSNTRANNPIEPSPTRNSDRHSPEKEVSVSVEASDKNGEETASSEKPQGGKSARLSDRGAGGDGDKPRSKRQKTQDNEYLRNFECDSDLSDVPSEFDYGNIDLSWETSKSSSPADLEPDTNIGKNKVVDTQKDVKKSVDNEKASKEVENVLNKFNEDEADASNRENSTSPSSAPVPSTVTEADSKEQKPPKDIVLRNVRGPGSLQAKILSIDGRIIDPPNGNAWKDFRCYRNNQDIGSLWDIRQAWYIRNYC